MTQKNCGFMPIRMTDYKPKCFTLVTQQHKQTSRIRESNLITRNNEAAVITTAVFIQADKSSSASKHHGCQRRGKTVSASLSRPRSRQRRLRARRPQYQQYHGARRRVLPYRHGRVVHGHRNVRFFENLFLYGLRQFRSRRVQRFLQNAIGLCVLSVFGCY